MTHYDYEHKEDDYIVSYDEMMNILREEYDIDDPTNSLDWKEYFTKTNRVLRISKPRKSLDVQHLRIS